jgi:hypothetical protein
MVAEPRPVGVAIDHLETWPESIREPWDSWVSAWRLPRHPDGIARSADQSRRGGQPALFGGHLLERDALQHASRACRALHQRTKWGPPSSASRCRDAVSASAPLFLAAGGHDLVTPGTEAWRIFEDARCEREIVYYPRGAHDCFNVISDLRPRVVSWMARKLERHQRVRHPIEALPPSVGMAAEAVDIDFAEALEGEVSRPVWIRTNLDRDKDPVRWSWPWGTRPTTRLEMIHRVAASTDGGTDMEPES